MGGPPEKTNLLDAAGYRYNFDRMMFVNRKVKKGFSREFVEGNPESVIQRKIQESNDSGDWRFYTNWPIANGVDRELRRVLG